MKNNLLVRLKLFFGFDWELIFIKSDTWYEENINPEPELCIRWYRIAIMYSPIRNKYRLKEINDLGCDPARIEKWREAITQAKEMLEKYNSLVVQL